MATRRQVNLTLVRPDDWQRQTTFDTPLDVSLLGTAIKARSFIEVNETVEDVETCDGEDLLVELVLGRFGRLNLELPDVDADELAGWLALAYGVTAAPSGGTNEVQTLTGTATGGTAQLAFTDLYNRRVTAALGFAATALEAQTALRALQNVGATGVVVAGGPMGTAPVTVTFQGPLANRNVATLEIIPALTGGGWAVVETTPGAGRTHNISRLGVGLYALPFTTFLLGHRGSSKQPLIFKNAVVDSVRCRAESRGKVTATIVLVGSADLQNTVGYTMPDCVDIQALRFGDCELTLNGVSLYDAAGLYGTENAGIAPLRSWEYYFQNDVLTGTYAFTGKGIDPTRFHRADKRPSGMNIAALGENGDTLYNLAAARATVAAMLQIGPPTDANVVVNVPQGLAKFDTRRVDYQDEANESTLPLVVRPKKVRGDATTPSNVVATSNEANAMLVAA